MTDGAKRNFHLIAPYAVWMVMMAALPATAWAYAARGAVTAVFLAFAFPSVRSSVYPLKGVLPGLSAGLLVFVVWIAPETLLGLSGSPVSVVDPSPYDPAVCGWGLTVCKLAASAFVISVAEELFFRVWLVGFAGFWWMVALFAVEHGERWHVGAVAGIIYGLLAKKYGVFAAIVAHAVTNLVLGFWVVGCGRWDFW